MFSSALGFAATPLKAVPYVDLKRWMGDWNVITNIPNFIEEDCALSIESYALRNDEKSDNGFVCKKGDGDDTQLTSLAWVFDTRSQGEWKIPFNLDTFLKSLN